MTRRLAVFMTVVAAVMFFFNYATPPTMSDDVLYRCVWTTDHADPRVPVRTLDDVVRSQVAHYQVLNGRLPVHVVAQTFLGIVGKDVFNVPNAIMFCLLVWLCARFSMAMPGSRRGGTVRTMAAIRDASASAADGLPSVILFTFIFFVLIPGFADAFLFFIGSFNYLWTATAVMLFLLYFYRAKDRRLQAVDILVCPLALLAGWTHEGLTLPLSAGFVLWMAAGRRRALSGAAFPAVSCFVVGTLLCVFSPGTMNRADGGGMTMAARVTAGLITMAGLVRVLWVLLAVAAVAWWKRRDVMKEEIRDRYVIWFALLPAYGIVMMCGMTEGRACVHAELLSSLLLVGLLFRLGVLRACRPLMTCACAVMASVTVAVSGIAMANRRNYDYQDRQQRDPGTYIIKVRQVADTGSRLFDMLVERYVKRPVTFDFYSCITGYDSSDINLRCAAALYGKPAVMYLPEDVACRIERDTATYGELWSDSRGDMSVMRIADGSTVEAVRFVLDYEDTGALPLYKRITAYRGDSYDLPPNKFRTVVINGRNYLFFTNPIGTIRRRLKKIDVVFGREQAG